MEKILQVVVAAVAPTLALPMDGFGQRKVIVAKPAYNEISVATDNVMR